MFDCLIWIGVLFACLGWFYDMSACVFWSGWLLLFQVCWGCVLAC